MPVKIGFHRFLVLIACEFSGCTERRNGQRLGKIGLAVNGVVNEQGYFVVLEDIAVFLGAATCGEDEMPEVIGCGEGHQTAVGLTIVESGQHGKTLYCYYLSEQTCASIRSTHEHLLTI